MRVNAADVRAELAAAGQAGPADDVIRDVAVALVDELGRGTFDMARAVATWKRCLQLALQLLFHGAIQVLRGDDAERRVRVRDALDAFFNKIRMANHLAQLGRFLAGNLRSLDPERCPNPTPSTASCVAAGGSICALSSTTSARRCGRA